jgi:hypothetical protein
VPADVARRRDCEILVKATDNPYQKRVINFTPVARRGTREAFLGAYIFLAREAASFVTGEIIYVDGGCHATETSESQSNFILKLVGGKKWAGRFGGTQGCG